MAEEAIKEEPKYSADPMLNAYLTDRHGPIKVEEPEKPELSVEEKAKAEASLEEIPKEENEKPDINKLILEKTGGKFKDIDELVLETQKEPSYKQPEFVNEDSKKVYDLILEGKLSEVSDILSRQNADYSKLSRLEVIKEGVKSENPFWSDEEVSDYVNDKYSVGEFVSEDDKVDMPPYQLKEKEARIARNTRAIERDGKAFAEKLSSKRSEIKLPDVSAKVNADPEIELLKNEAKAMEEWITQLDSGVKASPAAIEYKHTEEVEDGDGKVSFESDFKIEGDNKKALDGYVRAFLPPVGSEADYVKDGKVDVARITQEGIDKLFGKQMNKILLKQAIAQTKQSVIDGLKNVTLEPSEQYSEVELTAEEWLVKKAMHT